MQKEYCLMELPEEVNPVGTHVYTGAPAVVICEN